MFAKTVIRNASTNEYYCVPEIVDETTFPFWSLSKEDSFDFSHAGKFDGKLLAEHEMALNELPGNCIIEEL
jgi:hypothetical protein